MALLWENTCGSSTATNTPRGGVLIVFTLLERTAGKHGNADVWTVWHTSATTPAARALQQVAVQALPGCRRGRRARWRKKQTKSPPRVGKKVSKRGEHSDFESGDHMHLGILHVSMIRTAHSRCTSTYHTFSNTAAAAAQLLMPI